MTKSDLHPKAVSGWVAAAVALAVLAGLASGAPPAATRGPRPPSYVIPNIVAAGMVGTVLAIACKRFRRT